MKNPYQSKKRNTGARKRKRDILIAAEGKNKTERLYFSNFNSDSISVRFSHGNETDPLSLSKNLRNEYKNLELSPQSGDQAFCIVDEDLSPSQEQLILQAQKVLKRLLIILMWTLTGYSERVMCGKMNSVFITLLMTAKSIHRNFLINRERS